MRKTIRKSRRNRILLRMWKGKGMITRAVEKKAQEKPENKEKI